MDTNIHLSPGVDLLIIVSAPWCKNAYRYSDYAPAKIALLKTKGFTSIFSNADAEFLVWLCRNQKKFSHKALKVLRRGHKKEVFIRQHYIT